MSLGNFTSPAFGYAFLQLGVVVLFLVTAWRAWRHSSARLVELLTAFLFGLLLEQGDIFLFGTYRYNAHWVLLGDVPIAIALTWAMIIAGAMNITDALGIGATTDDRRQTAKGIKVRRSLSVVLTAPMADAVWAIVLDLALDAVAIRLGLWSWTIRADQGWFGVPWGNFFAWLFVAFWFSFFTRRVRAQQNGKRWQWAVPLLAFGGLIATLVPFVALENVGALPFVVDDSSRYHNQVWIIFALTLALFVGVTWWALLQKRVPRETPDHWLLGIRLVIHLLFLFALFAAGIYLTAPLLLVVALAMVAVELVFLWHWRNELRGVLRSLPLVRKKNVLTRNSIRGIE